MTIAEAITCPYTIPMFAPDPEPEPETPEPGLFSEQENADRLARVTGEVWVVLRDNRSRAPKRGRYWTYNAKTLEETPVLYPHTVAYMASPLRGVQVGDTLRIIEDGILTPWYSSVVYIGTDVLRVSCPSHQKEMLQTLAFWLTGKEAGREVCRPDKAYRATARPATAEEIAALLAVDPHTAAPVEEGGDRSDA